MNAASLYGHVIELLTALEHNNHPADRVVSQFLRDRHYLGSRDRRFISETVFGFTRHRRYVEALLEQFISDHHDQSILDEPSHRFVALLVVYSLTRGERESEFPHSLWTEHFPNLAIEKFNSWISGHQSLDYLEVDRTIRLAVEYSFQDWMVSEWEARLGEETESLLRSLNAPAPVSLRVNTLKADREKCRDRLAAEGIETKNAGHSPHGLVASKRFNSHASPAFKDGWYEIQDEGSQLVSLLAQLKPGQTVIDACAGAGGKTLHLSSIMENRGEIVAIDTDRRRLRELGTRASRAGAMNIKTLLRDEMHPDNFFGSADLVLVDAPCSGTGTIRRNPAFKWTVSESLIRHYHQKQFDLLEFNARFVKPGGHLVYATCSLMREENEGVVERFLRGNDSYHAVSPNVEPYGIVWTPDQPFITLFPHQYGTDGFFIAVMERKAALQ